MYSADKYQGTLFLLAYSCFLAALGLFFLIIVVKRRHYFPLSQRPLLALITEYLFIILYGIFSALYFGDVMNSCEVTPLLYFSFIFLSSGVLYRAFYVLLKYRINNFYSELVKEDDSKKRVARKAWFLAQRFFWESWRPFLIVLFIAFTIFMPFCFAVFGGMKAFGTPAAEIYENCNSAAGIIIYTVLFATNFFIGVILFILFRRNGSSNWIDALFTIRELKLLLVMWSLSFVVYIGLTVLGSNYILFGFTFFILTLHLCLTTLPVLYLSYQYSTSSQSSSVSRTSSHSSTTPFAKVNSMDELLQIVLDNPELKDLLNDFLKGIWCAENLAFIEEVQRLRQIDPSETEKIIEKVKEIGDMFSLNTSTPVINLDANVLNDLKEKLNGDNEKQLANQQFYDEAFNAISNILKADSLAKWKKSPYFPSHLVQTDFSSA
jgi:hypothetical protein